MAGRMICLVVIGFLLSGCASVESRWKATEQQDTVAGYEAFIRNYPKTEYASLAHGRIEELEFEKAKRAGTERAYEAYIEQFPKGRFIGDARVAINRLTEAAFESKLTEQIQSGDYARLISMVDEAKRSGYTNALNRGNDEIGRYTLSRVPPDGHVIWTAPSSVQSTSVELSIDIVCSASSDAANDELSCLLAKSRFVRTLERVAATPSRGREMATMLVQTYAEVIKSSTGCCPCCLYLYPTTADDRAIAINGTFQIQQDEALSFAATTRHVRSTEEEKAYKSQRREITFSQVSLTRLKQVEAEDRVFGLTEKVQEGQFRFLSLVFILQIPGDDLPLVTGYGFLAQIITDPSHTLSEEPLSAVGVRLAPARTLLKGTARLPDSRWTTLRPGLAVRGGAIRFEEKRILIVGDAEIAMTK